MNVNVTIITPSTLGKVKGARGLLVNSSYVNKMNVKVTIKTTGLLYRFGRRPPVNFVVGLVSISGGSKEGGGGWGLV